MWNLLRYQKNIWALKIHQSDNHLFLSEPIIEGYCGCVFNLFGKDEDTAKTGVDEILKE